MVAPNDPDRAAAVATGKTFMSLVLH